MLFDNNNGNYLIYNKLNLLNQNGKIFAVKYDYKSIIVFVGVTNL